MNKYQLLIDSLQANKTGTMKCYGSSMIPLLENPSTCSYKVEKSYKIGDIVFCKVNGRYIDAHKITKIRPDGAFMIANNHGFENGWTKTIFGRVVSASGKSGTREF